VVKFCYYLLFTCLGALIVHICVIFLIPSYFSQSIVGKLETLQMAQEGEGQFITLEREDPVLARLDPAFRIGVCYFDLSEGPVHLTARGDVPFWSLSLYGDDGSNLYSINSRVMPSDQLDLVIGNPLQIMTYKQEDASQRQGVQEGEDNVTITQVIERGFVILRSYIPSRDWQPLVEDFLSSARCSRI